MQVMALNFGLYHMGLIRRGAEITTEPSKSSFNALMEEKEMRKENKGETDVHRHGGRAISKEDKKGQYPKSFTESVSVA